jgi:histidine triad (HIT) family protein
MSCPFCLRVIRHQYDAQSQHAVSFEPLNPVTPGHLLVVPRLHVADRHLHIHIVPRREGDGLSLPWTGQRKD